MSDETFDSAISPICGRADLEIIIEADWAGAWLKPSGQVDRQTAPRLLDALEDLIDRGPRKVNLLLDGVSFMDGIGDLVLAQAQRLTWSHGVRLVLHSRERGLARPWLRRGARKR